MNPTVVVARDIGDFWFQAIAACFDESKARKYLVQKGSFEGEQHRYQLDSLTGVINFPETRPLSPITPEGVITTTDDAQIEKYFAEYLFSKELQDNEEYTYGSYISLHLPNIIELLRDTPDTNQATVNIGESINHHTQEWWKTTDGTEEWCMSYRDGPMVYKYPPCLRTVSFQVKDNKLITYTTWRSNDMFAAAATNLGGIQILAEYIASECGYETGEQVYFGSGSHVYDTAKPLAEQLLRKKITW